MSVFTVHLHIDFETRSAVDLRSAGVDVYSKDPTTDAWCMAYAFGDEPVELWKMGEPLPERIRTHVVLDRQVFAHNAAFELAIWNNCMVPKYGWPALAIDQTRCSAVRAYAMALPGSLEKAAPAAGLNHAKDMAGSRVMLQLSQPRDIADSGLPIWWEPTDVPEKFDRLYAYCINDIVVERALTKRLLSLSADEQRVYELDQLINQRGIYIDTEAVKTALQVVAIEKHRLDEAMRSVTEGAVATCTATKQLTEWLNAQGVEADGVAKRDVLELLADSSLPDQCRRALELRQEAAKSSTAKLKPMSESVSPDGRIRGILQYHGASTGRWAGRRLQPQNFPRPQLEQSDIERVFEILRGVR